MPLPKDALCYFRHPEHSWLWGKVTQYDEKKKQYSCLAVADGNSQAPDDRVPALPSSG
eukprot:gene17131-26295_t